MLQDMKPCTRCKVNLPIDRFTEKSSGELNKYCDNCLATQNKNRRKYVYECIHGLYKYTCLNPDCNNLAGVGSN